MHRAFRSGFLSFVLSAAAAVPSFAQSSDAPSPPAWGTTTESVLTIPSVAMNPPSSAFGYFTNVTSNGVRVYANNGDESNWWTGIQLPSGVVITRMEVEACDNSTTGGLVFGLARAAAPSGSLEMLSTVTETGVGPAPGCTFFNVQLNAPITVTNATHTYLAFARWTGAGAFVGTVCLRAVRIYYRLQVSPAPGGATFADVPVGSPLHPFVEALVAAGITGGCGGGNYCPNAALSRGQMAVFLSAALGLHFSN